MTVAEQVCLVCYQDLLINGDPVINEIELLEVRTQNFAFNY